MADKKKIYLPEHNGTLPIFLNFLGNPGNITAYAVPDTSAASFTYYKSYSTSFNTLGMGKLTNNLYILEDLGTYDNNVELRANLTFEPLNIDAETKYAYAIRGFEYQNLSDRLYTNKRGSTKVLLISGDALTNEASFLIKWEKNIPPYKEVISDDKKTVKIYTSDADGISESGTLTLTNKIGDTEINNDLFTEYFVSDINFYSMNINYSVKENNTTEPKYGLLGITSTIDEVECGFFNDSLAATGLYVSYWGYQFVIQAPKSGWICVKTPAYAPSYDYINSRRKSVYINDIGKNYKTDPTEIHYSIDGAELNGIYANADGKYEIYNNMSEDYYSTENTNYFCIYVPTIFNVTSYDVVAKDNTDEYNIPERVNIDYYQYLKSNTFVNDLDGIEYTAYIFDKADYLVKIILTVQ